MYVIQISLSYVTDFLAGTLSTGVIIQDREHAVMMGKSLHKSLKGLFLKRVRDFMARSSFWL